MRLQKNTIILQFNRSFILPFSQIALYLQIKNINLIKTFQTAQAKSEFALALPTNTKQLNLLN